MSNLDVQCAVHAQAIADIADESTVSKILGVLQEDGVYAFYLYSLALKKKSKAKAEAIMRECSGLLRNNNLITSDGITAENVRDIIAPLAADLDRLFFAKELLERTLVYARYHAKALTKEDGGT